jgi:Fe2+ transport system protein FeoA
MLAKTWIGQQQQIVYILSTNKMNNRIVGMGFSPGFLAARLAEAPLKR